jgi:hypothetical protein
MRLQSATPEVEAANVGAILYTELQGFTFPKTSSLRLTTPLPPVTPCISARPYTEHLFWFNFIHIHFIHSFIFINLCTLLPCLPATLVHVSASFLFIRPQIWPYPWPSPWNSWAHFLLSSYQSTLTLVAACSSEKLLYIYHINPLNVPGDGNA